MNKSKKIINLNTKRKNTKTYKTEQKIKDSSVLIFDDVCAVTLKYDRENDDAPVLTYKSKKISNAKLAANNLSIPIYKHDIASDIALTLKIDDEIRYSMYLPVAEILCQAYEDIEQDFDNFLNDAAFYSIFKTKLTVELASNLEIMLKSSDLLKKIEKTRKQTLSELGLILPSIKTKINEKLSDNYYVIKIGDNEVDRCEIFPDKLLMMSDSIINPKNIEFDVKEPAFNLNAKWIEKGTCEKEYIAVKPETVITIHLMEIIRKNAADLLTRQSIYQIFEKLKSTNSEEYVKDILDRVSMARIQAVLIKLLKEQVPIKEIEKILETINIYNGKNVDTCFLTEKVRQALSRTICEKNLNSKRELLTIVFSQDLEKKIAKGINEDGTSLSLKQAFVEKIFSDINKKFEKAIKETGEQPVLVCSSPLRAVLSLFVRKAYPQISVMSYEEICFDYKVKNVGTITA